MLSDGFTYIPLPTVTAISPQSGPISGGTDITITGANFVDGATVSIYGIAATDVVIVSPTQITAKTPPGLAGPADVVVTNPVSLSDTLKDGFTYIYPPSVIAISPQSGLILGGTEITITGADLQDGVTVRIGDKPAIDVTFVSSTEITAKTPAGDIGAVLVTVTNPDGQSDTHGFTYTNIAYFNIEANREYHLSLADLIIGIPTGAFTEDKTLEFELPISIPPFLGGLHNLNQTYTLRLTGETNPTFGQPLTLTFNYQEGQLLEDVSEESLRVYQLEDGLWEYIDGTVNTQNKTVTVNVEHFSTYSLLGGYAYGDITGNGEISSFDASIVLRKAVDIIGDLPPVDFPAFRLQTGNVSGTGEITSFDAALILWKSVGLPPHPDFPDRYTFPVEEEEPRITISHIPEPVTISIPGDLKTTPGAKGILVPVNITDVTERNVISADLVISYDTKVLTATGVTLDGTIAGGGKVQSKIDDSSGKINIGFIKGPPTLSGSGVLIYIVFDVEVNPPTNNSLLSSLKASLNEGEVVSEGTDGQIIISGVKTPPIITAINPSRGPESGGTPITITGDNFTYSTTVKIGGKPASNVVFVSNTQLKALTPAGIEGTVDVVVTNPDGQSYRFPGGFTYVSDSRLIHRIITAGEAYELSLFNSTLKIPAGTIMTDKTLEVEVPEATAPLLGGLHEMSLTYDLHFIGEDNAAFDQPLTLIFHYQEDALPQPQAGTPAQAIEESLQVYSQNGDLWSFLGGVVHTQQNTITVEIDRFSTYSLLAGYAYGDVSGDGNISAFDAALVLRNVVGVMGKIPNEEYPAYRFQTGDVSGNGRITAFDASMIMRRAVGLPPNPFHNRLEFPVEVQGGSPGKTTVADSLIPKALVTVKEVDEEIQIQLSIDNVERIIAADFHWSYAPKALQFVSVNSSATPERQITQINSATGDLKVGIASVDKLKEKEPLLGLNLS